MRDLLTDPCWEAHDLGAPLPDSPHAVSVSLPLWQHVIGYEEGDAAVTSKFQSGYPRFFLPPLVQQVFAKASEEFASKGELAMVLPTAAAADRCLTYVAKKSGTRGKAHPWLAGTTVITLPEADFAEAKLYWRFSGEITSTRLAEFILKGYVASETSPLASEIIKARLARLHKVTAEDVFLYPSGMAAVFAAHRLLLALFPNKPSLQLDFPYVDVLKVQEEFGGTAPIFLPVGNAEAVAQTMDLANTGKISAVFCEMPSNPLLRCVSLARLSPALKKGNVPLIVDDTVATCVNVEALRYADLVTTSLTKSFSGVGDVIAGSLVLNPASSHYQSFKDLLTTDAKTAPALFAADASALEANSRDFPKRVRRMSRNAAALADFLSTHPAVDEVYYPEGPELGEILKTGAGSGPLLSFTLKTPANAANVYDKLRVCKGPSLGSNFTLVCPYTLLAHYQELPWAADCGVAANLLRVSTGLEETDDLINRFNTALL